MERAEWSVCSFLHLNSDSHEHPSLCRGQGVQVSSKVSSWKSSSSMRVSTGFYAATVDCRDRACAQRRVCIHAGGWVLPGSQMNEAVCSELNGPLEAFSPSQTLGNNRKPYWSKRVWPWAHDHTTPGLMRSVPLRLPCQMWMLVKTLCSWQIQKQSWLCFEFWEPLGEELKWGMISEIAAVAWGTQTGWCHLQEMVLWHWVTSV